MSILTRKVAQSTCVTYGRTTFFVYITHAKCASKGRILEKFTTNFARYIKYDATYLLAIARGWGYTEHSCISLRAMPGGEVTNTVLQEERK